MTSPRNAKQLITEVKIADAKALASLTSSVWREINANATKLADREKIMIYLNKDQVRVVQKMMTELGEYGFKADYKSREHDGGYDEGYDAIELSIDCD